MTFVTMACGHKEGYDFHGSASYAIQRMAELRHKPCTNCLSVDALHQELRTT